MRSVGDLRGGMWFAPWGQDGRGVAGVCGAGGRWGGVVEQLQQILGPAWILCELTDRGPSVSLQSLHLGNCCI